MSDILISDADDRLVAALEARAKASGVTLDAEAEALLRFALERAPEAGYSPSEIIAIAGRSFPRDSTQLIRRDRDGVSDNELTSDVALSLVRDLRAEALQPLLPDSTPSIRMDRDG